MRGPWILLAGALGAQGAGAGVLLLLADRAFPGSGGAPGMADLWTSVVLWGVGFGSVAAAVVGTYRAQLAYRRRIARAAAGLCGFGVLCTAFVWLYGAALLDLRI